MLPAQGTLHWQQRSSNGEKKVAAAEAGVGGGSVSNFLLQNKSKMFNTRNSI
jgi:hypothetical protein